MHIVKPLSRVLRLLRAKDPEVFNVRHLRDVDRAIADAFPGSQAAVTVPVCRDAWEINADLTSGATQSNLVALDFPGRMDIVGIFVSLDIFGIQPTPAPPVPLIAPTLNDIRVQMRINEQLYRTANRMVPGSGSTIVLAALTSQTRIYSERLDNAQPKIDFIFSWRRPRDASGNLRFLDTNIALTLFANPIDQYRQE